MRSLFVILLAVAAASAGQEHVNCIPGTAFKMGCNICTCSNDGKLRACTDMACPEDLDKSDACEPGTVFHNYCNTCGCGKNGQISYCTRMYCDPKMWNKDGTLKIKPKIHPLSRRSATEQVCEPGTKFNDYCNTCGCAEDGLSFICTKMECDKHLWNKDGSMKVQPEFYKVEASEQVCQPGKKFNDYCNTCACSEDGLSYICSRRECDKQIWNQDGSLSIQPQSYNVEAIEEICEPGETFKYYCNTCGCASDGLSFVCTKRECDKDIWNQDGSLKVASKLKRIARSTPDQVCEPGKKFNDYCNTCGCADDGLSYICTRMECDKNIWNKDGSLKVASKLKRIARSSPDQVCEPGKKFNDYCNTCGCADDGLSYICTKMWCDTEIWNKDGSLKIVPETKDVVQSESKQVCKPRSQFKKYCNTCGCSDDGLSFICTRMACDESIWNEDGSLKINTKSQSFKQAYEVEDTEKWGPLYHQGDSCTPGKTFYSECNQCTCTESGKNAFCTFMACPEKTERILGN